MPSTEVASTTSAVKALSSVLSSLSGQVSAAALFAAFWCILIEVINPHLWSFVKRQSWWARAQPNQKAMMANFGFDKDKISDRQCLESFTWVITMCMTHLTSASLMLPVVARGWAGAGETGQLLFMLGTLAEVGFDLYDGPKLVMLSFFPDRFDWLGAPVPKLSAVLVAGLHHTTVCTMVIPMNMKYIHLPPYHYIGFSLLASAGICYTSGHYKFTVDAKTPEGLATCKKIVMLQFAMNWLSRAFIYFPASFYALKAFRAKNDKPFLYGGAVGMVLMGLYNLAVLGDATATAQKWLGKSVEDKKE